MSICVLCQFLIIKTNMHKPSTQQFYIPYFVVFDLLYHFFPLQFLLCQNKYENPVHAIVRTVYSISVI